MIRTVHYSSHRRSWLILGWSFLLAAVTVSDVHRVAAESLPRLVFSISTAGTICDSDDPGDCIAINDEDLIMCTPLNGSLPITQCDWSLYFDGGAMDIDLTSQLFSADIVPNGNIVFRSGGDRTLPDTSAIKSHDMGLFIPDNLNTVLAGGTYTSGTFKLFLDGDMTQIMGGAKPWDAQDVMEDGTCEKTITADGDHTCDVAGSLNTGGTLGGLMFENEDLLRCTPAANSSGGSITSCDYSLWLEADAIGGVNNGIQGDMEALEVVSFDPGTFSGQILFKRAGSTGGLTIPPHEADRDILTYEGTFGNGECSTTTAQLCAGDQDCPAGETCNTGTCNDAPNPACVSDGDCPGAGNLCNRTRTPDGTFSVYFDGSMAGLAGETIQAFAIVPDLDADNVFDGNDNCPDEVNPGQEDADGDGVGDLCEQCIGRPDPGTCDACPGAPCPVICAGDPDAECTCGDGIADIPTEECDLGSALNGQAGQPCSAMCQVIGKCTDHPATACDEGTDCPDFATGEGCCGNGSVDDVDGPGGIAPDEQCDDGNAIPDDDCDNACMLSVGGIPLIGCDGLLGPNVIPAFVKTAKIKDSSDPPTPFDRWKAKGDFNLAEGLAIDPDSELVQVIFNQATTAYSTAVPAGSFVQKGSNPAKPKWKYADTSTPFNGFRKGSFNLKENKIKYGVDGRNVALAIDPMFLGGKIRQTIRSGDVCATAILSCESKSGGKLLKCSSALVP